MTNEELQGHYVYVIIESRNYESIPTDVFANKEDAEAYIKQCEAQESLLRWYPHTTFAIEEFRLK